MKRSLRKVLFRASVTYEELQTTIVEVEGIVNSRPLTYAYDNDVEEILTPSHLLLGRRLLSTFEEPFDDGCTVDNAVLTKRMAYLRSLSEHFWKIERLHPIEVKSVMPVSKEIAESSNPTMMGLSRLVGETFQGG